MIDCRSVFGAPSRFAVSTYWNYVPGAPTQPASKPAHGYIGMASPLQWRMTVGISPVTVTASTFGPPGALRSGTPISYAGKSLVRRMQMQTATATVSLKDLAGL
jgi:hypothetical protein